MSVAHSREPEGWPTAPLTRVADLVRGVSYPKTDAREEAAVGYVPLLRATNIQDANLVLKSDLVFIADRNVSPDQLLRPGDIVVATSSGSKHLVGKSGQLRAAWYGSFGAFCAAIRPKQGIDSRFLALFLQAPAYWRQITKKALGVNINNLRRGDLETIDVPLPPLEVQGRIVAEIERQFSRLDEAVANLKGAKAKFLRHRASILRAAVAGTLTGKNVSTHNGPLDFGGPLPRGWTWASAQDLATTEPGSIGAGPFGTIFKAKDFRTEGVPIIFLRHVGPMKYLQDKPGYMDRAKWEELFRPYSVFGGELLITKLGEPPGVCAIYPVGIGPAMVTPDVIKMRVASNRVLTAYLMYYFNSEVARRFATGAAFGTTRTRLTLPLFRQMPVVVPTLEDQHLIVAEVERRLSLVRATVAEVDANLRRAELLRRSVLERAFGLEADRRQ